MSHKRSKKDVEEAYRRGFQDGFNVRPNPLAMLLRSIWKRHENKKAAKAWRRLVRENDGAHPAWRGVCSESIGRAGVSQP